MLKNKFKNAIKDFGGIDELINHRQRKIVAAYNESIFKCASYKKHSNLSRVLPSNLKYGGYRNTCYDFRR